MNHKLNTKWKFAVTPDVVIKHYPSAEEGEHEKFRHNKSRIDKATQHFLKKWNLKCIIIGNLFIDDTNEHRTFIHKMIINDYPISRIKNKDRFYRLKLKLIISIIKTITFDQYKFIR